MRLKAVSGMMLTLLLIGMLTLTFNIQHAEASEPPATEWTKTYGGSAYSVVETSDGGYALAGITGEDFWLVKVDSSGDMEWNKTYGGWEADCALSVVDTSDGGYALAGWTDLAGWTESFGASHYDFWLVKVDSSGDMEWNKTYGGGGDEKAWSAVETGDGGYVLAGSTRSFGAGEWDFWLVKVDSSGNMQWNKTFGGWEEEKARSVVETSDGGYALAGWTNSFGAGEWAFWLVKVDSSGDMEWNKTYGGWDDDTAYSVVEMSDGGYALAGYTTSFGAGATDFWLVKVDSSGNMQWNKTYGGADGDVARSVVETSDGGYALAGYTNSFGAGEWDFWLVKVDSSGNMQWNKTFGGWGDDNAWSVVETSDGGYALAGVTDSFGGIGDAWLIKLAGPPEYTLTIYSSPTGVTFTVDGVSRTAPWSGTYTEGTSVSLVMPETHDGYVWSHWLEEGDTNRIKALTMDTNITLTAVFTPETQKAEPSQLWIVAIIVVITVVAAALLVYFTKIKKTTEKVK